MKIGVDFHTVDGIFQGSRSHLIELFSQLIPMAPNIEFYLFLDRPEMLSSLSSIFTYPNVHAIRMERASPARRLCSQLPAIQRRYSFDIFHTQYIMPIPSFSPCVVTIHDVLFETYPQFFSSFFNWRSKLLIKRTARKAKHIFTVSEYSKNDIIKKYGVSSNKITVIYNGVNTAKFYPGSAGEETISRWGLRPGGYILSVGRIEPRKNYVTLLKAYAATGHALPPLVIVGQNHFGYRPVAEAINALSLKNKVILLNNLGDNDLPAVYRHAKLFIYPSWAEGFGMPILEAMASGVPVICSNATALPEIAGHAALLSDPADDEQLSNAIRVLLDDTGYQHKMREDGLFQAAKFSWTIAAEKTLAGYKKALES